MMTHAWRHRAFFSAVMYLLADPSTSRAQSEGDRDLKTISSYQLSMPRYRQYLNALVNLAGTAERDPKLREALGDYGHLSIDQSIKRFDGIPVVRRAIADAGLTTRDFILTQAAFLQTGLAYALMKQMNLSPDSVVKTAKVSRANLDFYQKNEAEINRLTKEYEAKVPASLREDEAEDADSGTGESE
jgi:hypothetical protein